MKHILFKKNMKYKIMKKTNLLQLARKRQGGNIKVGSSINSIQINYVLSLCLLYDLYIVFININAK